MLKLEDFVINEEAGKRGRPKKNVEVDTTAQLPKRKIEGKKAEKNETNGLWAVDEPLDESAYEPLEKATMTKNVKALMKKFDAEEPFFIIGKAGWGKTSLIKNMAGRYKRSVLTVYLDKAVATDLGGIPVPVEGRNGTAVQKVAMPGWAAYMLEHPEKDFLLFFDEMNQAQPDVMNALMPIVLETTVCGIKFDNFIVGAAGNFESENGAVNELSGPLKSRFKPLIEWETGGENWKSAFRFIHKEWDDKVGADMISEVEKNCELFDNPREVEHKIIKWCYKVKSKANKSLYDVDDFLDRLKGLAKEDITRMEEKDMVKLAEYLYQWFTDANNKNEGNSGRKRTRDQFPTELMKMIDKGMSDGYVMVTNDDNRYGVSEEDVISLFEIWNMDNEDNQLNREQFDSKIESLLNQGKSFKYKTKKQYIAAGFKDPLAD